jgi:hypothetical protein
MNMNGEVSQMAGQVWHALSTDGPHTLVQLKKKLNATGESGMACSRRQDRNHPGQKEFSGSTEVRSERPWR